MCEHWWKTTVKRRKHHTFTGSVLRLWARQERIETERSNSAKFVHSIGNWSSQTWCPYIRTTWNIAKLSGSNSSACRGACSVRHNCRQRRHPTHRTWLRPAFISRTSLQWKDMAVESVWKRAENPPGHRGQTHTLSHSTALAALQNLSLSMLALYLSPLFRAITGSSYNGDIDRHKTRSNACPINFSRKLSVDYIVV